MQAFPFPIIAQLDLLGSVLTVVVAVVGSFATITLVASYYRFLHVVDLAENTSAEEMGSTSGEVLRVQMARFIAGCARRNASFGLSLVRTGSAPRVSMDSPIVEAIKQAVRSEDVVCVFDEETAALFTEAEPEDMERILSRIVAVVQALPGIDAGAIRVGMSSYPGHGLSGKELVRVAAEGLEQASAEHPIFMPEIVDVEEAAQDEDSEDSEEGVDATAGNDPGQDGEEAEAGGKGRGRRKKAEILDPVTGVLGPAHVSVYMQRLMGDIRYKKHKGALFCIGVNNMDHIERFHGELVANDVLAGVSGILQKNFRATDLIGRHEKYAFIVLSKCEPEDAEKIAKRVGLLVQLAKFESGKRNLKTSITVGVATYPKHGKNLHQLYLSGQRVLDYSRTNDIRAYSVYDPEIHDKVVVKPMRSIKSTKA